MCPAVIFAANRKDRVIGRTRFLTVSIKIKMGLINLGALLASSLARKGVWGVTYRGNDNISQKWEGE